MERHRVAGLLLVLVGVAGLLSPLAIYQFHAPQHQVSVLKAGDDVPSDATVVSYEALTERERAAVEYITFRESPLPDPTEPGDRAFSQAEWRRADGLSSHEYVEYEGVHYSITERIFVATPRTADPPVDPPLLPTVGAVLAVVGALMLRVGSVRPMTPLRASAVPLTTIAAYVSFAWLQSVAWFARPLDVPPLYGVLVVVPSAFLVGSILARRDAFWAGAVTVCLGVAYRADLYRVPPLDNHLALISGFVAAFFAAGFLMSARVEEDSPPDRTSSPA